MPEFISEFYTKHPITGEGGHEIRGGWITANTLDEARALVHSQPFFDTIISLYQANRNGPFDGANFVDYNSRDEVWRFFTHCDPGGAYGGRLGMFWMFSHADQKTINKLNFSKLLRAHKVLKPVSKWGDHDKQLLNQHNDLWYDYEIDLTEYIAMRDLLLAMGFLPMTDRAMEQVKVH